jgi:hypothetical protein
MTDVIAPRPPTGPFKRYLDDLEKITAHKELAVSAALHFCAEENIVPPKWVVEGSAILLCDLLKREKSQTPGRASGNVARYRQSMWDVERWNAVEQIRVLREQMKADAALIRGNQGTFEDFQTEHVAKMQRWLRRYGTFACASMYLHGRYARAGVDAMRSSHRRVRRANENSKESPYKYIDPRFLWAIGIDDRNEVPGTKWVPLYNLTP